MDHFIISQDLLVKTTQKKRRAGFGGDTKSIFFLHALGLCTSSENVALYSFFIVEDER